MTILTLLIIRDQFLARTPPDPPFKTRDLYSKACSTAAGRRLPGKCTAAGRPRSHGRDKVRPQAGRACTDARRDKVRPQARRACTAARRGNVQPPAGRAHTAARRTAGGRDKVRPILISCEHSLLAGEAWFETKVCIRRENSCTQSMVRDQSMHSERESMHAGHASCLHSCARSAGVGWGCGRGAKKEN